MSYVVPSVQVYQQLATNGGVANATPDLDSCIIGPCYNVVDYDNTSAVTLLRSWATNLAGTATISLASDSVPVDTYLPSPGINQLVDTSSLLVYLNNAQVQTEQTRMMSHSAGAGGINPNTLTVGTLTGVTVSVIAFSKIVTIVGGASTLNANDSVTIAGAGPGGVDLVTTITSITSATVFVIADNARITTTGLALTKQGFHNLNANSATLRVEPGDTVAVVAGSGSIFYSTVLSIVSAGNVVSTVNIVDNLPTTYPNSSSFTTIFSKAYNNLLLPAVYNAYTNYTTANLTTTGDVQIQVAPQVSYGTVQSGEVHLQYRALRQDLLSRIIEIDTIADIEGTLGVITDKNPLALAVQLALANTVGRILAITVTSNDLLGYQSALDLAQSQRMYTLVPLTQDLAILQTFQQHVDQLSTPEKANWRGALVNTALPTASFIGQYTDVSQNSNGGNNSSATTGVITSSNSTFITDGVVPGDILVTQLSSTITKFVISAVISNQLLQVVGSVLATAGFSLYVQRTLTKVQQAAAVAAVSTTFSNRHMVHVQPDLVGISIKGVVKFLPGYYLCAAISGLMSGLPAQQGLTNIGIAGVSDLQHSNFYFTSTQMNTMAAAGTFLVAQESQGNIPYVRHSLTTDVSVLQYREVQQVKNIDFLSYYFYDILKSFAGRWNITPDVLQILRTTISAGGENLKKKVLPKVGPPLLSYTIKSLAQDTANLDQVNIELPVKIPTVMNYINLYLIY